MSSSITAYSDRTEEGLVLDDESMSAFEALAEALFPDDEAPGFDAEGVVDWPEMYHAIVQFLGPYESEIIDDAIVWTPSVLQRAVRELKPPRIEKDEDLELAELAAIKYIRLCAERNLFIENSP